MAKFVGEISAKFTANAGGFLSAQQQVAKGLKDLKSKFGETSALGGIGKIAIGAGAVMGVGLIARGLETASEKTRQWVEELASGKKSAEDIGHEFIKAIPVLGSLVTAAENFWMALSGGAADVAFDKALGTQIDNLNKIEKRLGSEGKKLGLKGMDLSRAESQATLERDLEQIRTVAVNPVNVAVFQQGQRLELAARAMHARRLAAIDDAAESALEHERAGARISRIEAEMRDEKSMIADIARLHDTFEKQDRQRRDQALDEELADRKQQAEEFWAFDWQLRKENQARIQQSADKLISISERIADIRQDIREAPVRPVLTAFGQLLGRDRAIGAAGFATSARGAIIGLSPIDQRLKEIAKLTAEEKKEIQKTNALLERFAIVE